LTQSAALHYIGEQQNITEILDIVEKDSIFYGQTDGGLTLSGGEPLLQKEFAMALLNEAKLRHIHCAIETTGHAPWPNLYAIAASLDYVLYDIKIIDDTLNQKWTGVSNVLILDNLCKLAKIPPNLPLHVRTPIIPGFNDNIESINAILDFLDTLP